jgi:hypothetical protein
MFGSHKAAEFSSTPANFGMTSEKCPSRGEFDIPLVNRNAVVLKCRHWNCEPTLRRTVNAGSRRILDGIP